MINLFTVIIGKGIIYFVLINLIEYLLKKRNKDFDPTRGFYQIIMLILMIFVIITELEFISNANIIDAGILFAVVTNSYLQKSEKKLLKKKIFKGRCWNCKKPIVPTRLDCPYCQNNYLQ